VGQLAGLGSYCIWYGDLWCSKIACKCYQELSET